MQSISIFAAFGSAATWKVERAGAGEEKSAMKSTASDQSVPKKPIHKLYNFTNYSSSLLGQCFNALCLESND